MISVRESTSHVLGLTPAQHRTLQDWFNELERPCAPDREERLVRQVCETLSGYMGIEPDMLFPAFLTTVRRERQHRVRDGKA